MEKGGERGLWIFRESIGKGREKAGMEVGEI